MNLALLKKQAHIDFIPENWNLATLQTVLSVDPQNGYSPNCPDEPNGKWVLGLGNLTDSGFNPKDAKPAPLNDPLVDNFMLSSGDFLISRSNTPDKVGRAALFRGELSNCSYPDLMMRFRVNESKANPDFIEKVLTSRNTQCYYQTHSAGSSSTMVKINKSVVTKTPILLPPLPEQKAIADLLSTWDAAIEKTERLIGLKEKRLQWLLDELIGKPSREGKWDELPAMQLFKERRETNLNQLPLLSITGNEGVIPREETNRKDTSNEDKSKYLRICSGDIGYNTMRMWQGVSALSTLEGLVSPAYTILKIREKLDPEFTAILFKTPFMIHRFYRYSQGLTPDTWNLKFHHFCEVKVPLPEMKEQKRIATLINDVAMEIKLFERVTDQFKTQKRGLMQKLLTGEWRVKVKESV